MDFSSKADGIILLFNENYNFFIVLWTILGLFVGSFIGMLSYRIPLSELHDKKLNLLGSSYCPSCNEKIKFFYLFPVFGWAYLKGKCNNCSNKISIRYPIIEIITAFFTFIIIYFMGFSLKSFILMFFFWVLILISVIDYETHYIFDNLSLPLLWVGLIVNTQNTFTSLNDAIWGAIWGYLILWFVFHSFKIIFKKEGMGFGDFKLFSAIGAWYGVLSLPTILIVSNMLFIFYVLLKLIVNKIIKTKNEFNKDMEIPFGPFLSISAIFYILFKDNYFFSSLFL